MYDNFHRTLFSSRDFLIFDIFFDIENSPLSIRPFPRLYKIVRDYKICYEMKAIMTLTTHFKSELEENGNLRLFVNSKLEPDSL